MKSTASKSDRFAFYYLMGVLALALIGAIYLFGSYLIS